MRYFSESDLELRKGTAQSGGYDLPFYDKDEETIVLQPGCLTQVKTGIHMEIPENHIGILDVRSHVGKLQVDLMCRMIDADYRGNIRLMMVNHGNKPVIIKRGEYPAQIVIVPCHMGTLEKVGSKDELSVTERGEKGFGHSGKGVEGGNK